MLRPETIEELIAAAVYAEAWFTNQECTDPHSLDYRAFQAADRLREPLGKVEHREDYREVMEKATADFKGDKARMNTDKITSERLEGWRARLKEENATPIVLIGIGHEAKSGQLVICVPEGVDDNLLVGSLRYALEVLRPGSIPKHHGQRAEFRK